MDFTNNHSQTIVGGQTGFAIPLIVAVTGHRDLCADEIPRIEQQVFNWLKELQESYPDRGVTVMSALAEGADQIVAEQALRLNIPLIVPLPMPKQIYAKDFESRTVRDKFEALYAQSAEAYELPVCEGASTASIREYGPARDQQYAQLGVFLCAHCHILLALWDGKYNDKLGGTGQVVRFHHDDVMPGYTSESSGSGFILADDESDLVYHIVCSRNRENGGPVEDLNVGDSWWFSLDKDEPRSRQLPESHRRVFEYTSEFSADASLFSDRISSEAYSLLDDSHRDVLPAGLWDINHVFCSADWLAIHFQKRIDLARKATHILAGLMGLMYIIYSDVESLRIFLYAFLGFFVLAFALHSLGIRYAWHRKYLDYRTLAEGLRVQFYWAAAGARSSNKSKFSHDTFLQTQDPDLGWIRNVMRVAGTECDALQYNEQSGLQFTLQEWIGDLESGQLGYFRRKGAERSRRFKRTEYLSKMALWLGVLTITLFVLISVELGDAVRDPVILVMGIMLLFVGVRQSYSHNVADAELIKQYEFMYRIFENARRRVDLSTSDEETRRVLLVLGDAALGEHAQWILMNRERSLDSGEVFQMGS